MTRCVIPYNVWIISKRKAFPQCKIIMLGPKPQRCLKKDNIIIKLAYHYFFIKRLQLWQAAWKYEKSASHATLFFVTVGQRKHLAWGCRCSCDI